MNWWKLSMLVRNATKTDKVATKIAEIAWEVNRNGMELERNKSKETESEKTAKFHQNHRKVKKKYQKILLT